ncbi:hypothetical protein ACTWQF_10015 [Streptomyces sp. 8N114]|uniref:hypothetical protein n=1 Tax=Streptomyces sp. 8N114 TaxID=3457419 RepID=UPI003FD2E3A4
MKRSALVMASLLLGSVACDVQGSDDGKGTDGGEANPAVSTGEARRVVKELDKKEDSGSLSPAYWHKIQEGPWLDRSLVRIDNVKMRGKPDDKTPSNHPRLDSAVHAWAAKPRAGGGGEWILGARQVSSSEIGGESKNTAEMRWSLHHRDSKDGPWRTALVVMPRGKKDLPKAATNKSKAVPTVSSDEDLAVQPGRACGAFDDYVSHKTTGKDLRWSKQIKKYRNSYGDTTGVRKAYANPKSAKVSVKMRRTPLGPAWRTQDGGALVACTRVSETAVDMGPGRWFEMEITGWDNISETRWNTFTQTLMTMTMLKVPANGSPISIAADTTWPYKFNGTEYTGS